MPDWCVLISTLGGMALFGINGFVIGAADSRVVHGVLGPVLPERRSKFEQLKSHVTGIEKAGCLTSRLFPRAWYLSLVRRYVFAIEALAHRTVFIDALEINVELP